jgi:hypothetical protein
VIDLSEGTARPRCMGDGPSCPEMSERQGTAHKPRGRGTSNRDARGNSRDRAARRQWLLTEFGNGVTAPCYRFEVCGAVLDDATITVDRIVPGCKGGRYVRDNIRPACGPCNSETGGRLRR